MHTVKLDVLAIYLNDHLLDEIQSISAGVQTSFKHTATVDSITRFGNGPNVC